MLLGLCEDRASHSIFYLSSIRRTNDIKTKPSAVIGITYHTDQAKHIESKGKSKTQTGQNVTLIFEIFLFFFFFQEERGMDRIISLPRTKSPSTFELERPHQRHLP